MVHDSVEDESTMERQVQPEKVSTTITPWSSKSEFLNHTPSLALISIKHPSRQSQSQSSEIIRAFRQYRADQN